MGRGSSSLGKRWSSRIKDLIIRRNKSFGVICKKKLTSSSWNDQTARVWQLCDPEFTICKFMIKMHIVGKFMYQIGVFYLLINKPESNQNKRKTSRWSGLLSDFC
jgi:hypothetical protein